MSKARSFFRPSSNYYHPPGTEPGTLVNHVEDEKLRNDIHIIKFSPDYFCEKTVNNLEELGEEENKGVITWINIDGRPSAAMLESLGKRFHLHPLSLEDVLNSGQRSKIDFYDNYYFIVMYLLQDNTHTAWQVSIFSADNTIITLAENEEDAFELIRTRLRSSKGMIRNQGADYLCYSICDALIDRYFPGLTGVRDHIDLLEESVFTRQGDNVIEEVHNLKIQLIAMEKYIWEAQEVVNTMLKDETSLIDQQVKVYLRDSYDHTIQLLSIIASYREISSSILESYLSLVNNQMNEVMKVLTLIATIFIPLTFVAGIYGMNFNPKAGPLNMPELNWPYGYITILGLMLIIAFLMFSYFRRRKWF